MKTHGYIIRFENCGQVQFLAPNGVTAILQAAKVFTYKQVAYRHDQTTHGASQHVVSARLDDEGKPAWIHPQWLKTGEEIEAERAEWASRP